MHLMTQNAKASIQLRLQTLKAGVVEVQDRISLCSPCCPRTQSCGPHWPQTQICLSECWDERLVTMEPFKGQLKWSVLWANVWGKKLFFFQKIFSEPGSLSMTTITRLRKSCRAALQAQSWVHRRPQLQFSSEHTLHQFLPQRSCCKYLKSRHSMWTFKRMT